MKHLPPSAIDHFAARLFSLSHHGLRSLLSVLFPWSCPGCRLLLTFPAAICEECAGKLPRIARPFCRRCGDPFPPHWKVKVCPDCSLHRRPYRSLRSAFPYEGLVRKMIRDAKYGGCARYLRFFSEELYVLSRREFTSPVEAIVPVPLHRSREWRRTFNQAELLASGMSALWGIPVWKPLRKERATRSQSSLSGLARRANLSGAFVFHRARTTPSTVLLVDDVVTTGTTMAECARTLRRGGVRRVYCISIARAMLRNSSRRPLASFAPSGLDHI